MPVTFNKQISFSAKPESRLDEYDFDGGLVTDKHEIDLQSNQSPNMANVLFNTTKSVKTRNGSLRYNTTPVGIASDTTNFGASTGSLAVTTLSTWVVQTFIPSGAIKTIQVNLSLAMNTAGKEQQGRLELWSTATGAPSTLLTTVAKSQIKLISGTSETTYSFIIRTPIALAASTTYAIVFKPFVPGNGTTVNRINVHHTGNAYANGQVYTTSTAGSSWSADSAKDLKFTVYSGGDTPCTGMYRFYGPGGVQQLIAKFGTSLYRGDDAAKTLTAITPGASTTFASANYTDWATVNDDTLLVCDGLNFIQKYRGSTNANYSTGTITVTTNSRTVTGSGTSWGTTTNAEANEYIKLPDNKWYKITAVNGNTDLTIETAYKPATTAGATYIISAWGEVQGKLDTTTINSALVRPTPSFMALYEGRLWTLEGNDLRFSNINFTTNEEHFNDFDTPNKAGHIVIDPGKGDLGTGLYALGNSLYIFQKHAIWRLYGNSPANFEVRNVTNEIGMISKKTLVEWNDVLIFQSDGGVYMFDGSNLKNISDKVVNKLIATWADKDTPFGVLWDNKYIISYTPSSNTFNSEAICYDLNSGMWSRFTGVYPGVWGAWTGGTDKGEVYFGSSNQGSIYKWDISGNDDGYEIEMFYDTPSIGFAKNANQKTLKKVYIQQLEQKDYSMTVTMYGDIVTPTVSTIDLSPNTESNWDTMQWDSGTWSGEGRIITSRVAEFQGLAQFFKFRFSHTGYNEPIEVLGLTCTARVRRLI